MAARLVFVDTEGRPRMIIQTSRHQFAVAVLDRHGTARAMAAYFLREDGTQEVYIGFYRAGIRRLFTVTVLPNADARQRNLEERLRGILFGPDDVSGLGLRGGPPPRLQAAVLGLQRLFLFGDNDGADPRLEAAPLALARPRANATNPEPAMGVINGWRRMVIATGLDSQARHRLFLDAAALGLNAPSRPHTTIAALGVDGPSRPHTTIAALGVNGLPRFPLLAAVALGVDGPMRFPPPIAAALGHGAPPRPLIPTAPCYGMLRSSSLEAMYDEVLRRMEEGLGPLSTDKVPSSASKEFLSKIFDFINEAKKAEFNLEESNIIEATLELIIEMLSHMSDRARSQILSNPALSSVNQHDMAHHPQQNMGMWRSFVATVGLTVVSNIILYFLSVAMRHLEQMTEGSSMRTCSESPSAEPPRDTWTNWIVKFIAWLVERVIAPALLTWFVVLVREYVIDNEMHMLQYQKNGTVNVLVNSLSRVFFFGIRGFPGISQPDLWARMASVIIDLLGAAFLWWMQGHWDPDIADG